MLYKILLVDDEAEIRESIIKKIQWESIGFKVASDAENGRDALEKIEVLEPDVILTDIKMPYMDGLELAEYVKHRYPSIKILIFSGFDEFEYAKQAIKANVIEYILKPIDAEELTKTLKKIKENLDAEIEHRRNIDNLRDKYLKSLPIIKEHFLLDLIHGKIEEDRIKGQLSEFNSSLAQAVKWTVANIQIGAPMEHSEGKNQALIKEEELLPISVKQLVDDSIGKFCEYQSIQSSNYIHILTGLNGDQSMVDLLAVFDHVCKECKRILGLYITIGVGQPYDNISLMPDSYQEAKDALGYEAIVGTGCVIYINDVEPIQNASLEFDEKSRNALSLAVKFGGKEEIDKTIQSIVAKTYEVKVHRSRYQAYVISIMNAITQLMQRYEVNDVSVFGKEVDYMDMMEELVTAENLKRWLCHTCTRLSEVINMERNNNMTNIIRDAKLFIYENYQNPELSVEMLCKHLHISPAYFSTLFKKETGKSYVNYLTELRLDKAAELLNTTTDKTYIIARKVGYMEQNYFSYVFKKQFGVSPTNYRGNQ